MSVWLEILGDDGEWHEVHGVTNVEFHPTGPDVSDEEWRRHDARDALRYMVTGVEEARRPKVVDQDGRPVRPAWQSPYGPPPRRH